MSSNSVKFIDRFFTQIGGATIGSPDSGSITDIFGAIHIDKKSELECPKNQKITNDIEMIRLISVVTLVKSTRRGYKTDERKHL